MDNRYLFTSESVTEGHPDKLCDRIADGILDAYLRRDPTARVACEVTAARGMSTVMGQITSCAVVDIQTIVRHVVRETGYADSRFGFCADDCAVVILVDRQSEDINAGVSCSLEKRMQDSSSGTGSPPDPYEAIGAGDQGMMFGYACNETRSMMPAPIYYANQLCKRMSFVRKNRQLNYLGPDGKAMVTFEYVDGVPERIQTIVLSAQHTESVSQDKIREDLIGKVVRPMVPEKLLKDTDILVNPSGRFVYGGPCADTGLTGRKIIVDTYGGAGRHGGGAFSGKDPTKVDRTGAYAARYIAKNIVAAGLASRCEVQLAYAIGVAVPVCVQINTFGTGKREDPVLEEMVSRVFDLRPAFLIEAFGMRKPIYEQLAAYGHFGRSEYNLAWEKTDKTDEIHAYLTTEK